MDHLREVLCVLSEPEEDVQGLDSRILRQPDLRVLMDFGSRPAEAEATCGAGIDERGHGTHATLGTGSI
eukprot:5480675-Pleurochrysis_carterae.AAC.1